MRKAEGVEIIILPCSESISLHSISNDFEGRDIDDETKVELYTFYLKILRWEYQDLVKSNLLSEESLTLHNKEEQYFVESLPWKKNTFIRKMKMKNKKLRLSLSFFQEEKCIRILEYLRN